MAGGNSLNMTVSEKQDLENVNIFELLEYLGEIQKGSRVPGPEWLIENFRPVVSRFGCTVFSNGYVIYELDGRRTVMWLPDCAEYICWFVRPKSDELRDVPSKMVYDMHAFPWVYAVMLRGDERMERNLMDAPDVKRRIWKKGESEGADMDDFKPAGAGLNNGSRISGPEDTLIMRETMQEALKKLPERKREMFVMYFYYGYTLNEIADKFGLSFQRVSQCLLKPDSGKRRHFWKNPNRVQSTAR